MEHSKQERTKISTAALTCAAVITMGMIDTAEHPASANDDDYMYCYFKSSDNNVFYHSSIFLGDYLSDSRRAEREFHNYLEDIGEDPRYFSVFCRFYDTYRLAEVNLEYQIASQKMFSTFGREWGFVDTNWSPSFATPEPTGVVDRAPGADGCYFGECPSGQSSESQSPNTSHQTLQQTLICQTPEGWCKLASELPFGDPCGCRTQSGQHVEGNVAFSRP